MSSVLPGFEYDIFISYRQKDNKGDGWVTAFVEALKTELEATFKEDISVYFDINPHDGLLETHDVDESLKSKLKCLVFIPIVSRTYCDPKSFAWEHEFRAFVELASRDQLGLKVKLSGGNVANRILPVQIHELDKKDEKLLEDELGGHLRSLEFIYQESGVNRPLTHEDDEKRNLKNTRYRNQINKLANSIAEIISALGPCPPEPLEVPEKVFRALPASPKRSRRQLFAGLIVAIALITLGLLFVPKLFKQDRIVDKSIAVLPFENISPDPEQEYFADGMVEEILDRLYNIGGLHVINRTSKIARELGVSAVLEGSVRKSGNNVRITAKLIDSKTGIQLWSHIYERDLADVFSIQSEVAENVAQALKVTLTTKEKDRIRSFSPVTSQLARDLYLHGIRYIKRAAWSPAIEMLSKAIQEDSLFAAAYAQRARVHLLLFYNMGGEIHKEQAKVDIQRGMQIDPELPEMQLARALSLYYIDLDYDQALKILEKLMKEMPSWSELYIYKAGILRWQDKWEESVDFYKTALKLDPFDGGAVYNLSLSYGALHQYDQAIEILETGLELIPDHPLLPYLIFDFCLKKTGDLNGALKKSGLTKNEIQCQFDYYSKDFGKLMESVLKDSTFNCSRAFFLQDMITPEYICYLSGNQKLCTSYAESSIASGLEELRGDPENYKIQMSLGKSYALSGNEKDAIACGEKAINMLPVSKKAIDGPILEKDLMEIYIFTGHNDLALKKIEKLLSVPSSLGIGNLIIDPVFDKLRSLPKFQKIIDSARKKSPPN